MSLVRKFLSSPVPKLKIRDLILCIISAILLILSFPNFNLWLCAWVGFVPLFFALQNKSKLKAFFLAYLCGVIFWFGTIYWLIHVTLPGTILLVLYLALYFGVFGLVLSISYLLPPTYYLLFIPSAWVILEYLRSYLFTGFPWALLGYSQYLNLLVIQISDITGAWGVSFLVMIVNVFIYKGIGHRLKVKGNCLLPIFILLSVFTYGYYKLGLSPFTLHLSPIKISVIQPNIPQELKWDPKAKDFIVDKYLALSAGAQKDSPDLIIWPEAALPTVLEEEPRYYERVSSFVKEMETPLLFGAVTSRDAEISAWRRDTSKSDYIRHNLYYNSALLLSAEGKLLTHYDKLHLVPFGEYIPLKNIFPFLETIVPIGDFTRGKEYTIFSLPTTYYLLPTKFSVLICFEDLFSELSRRFVKKGADFLVNITNDAWYKQTSAAEQHFQASVFRAVENRVPLVRAANTGISGFIASTGKIVSLVKGKNGENIFISGYRTEDIGIFNKNLTFYTRFGDVFVFVCLFLCLHIIISRLKRKP